ncbi:ABC transporter ATP-binding protein [Paraclostridium bifermentans]|uniref:ABC transporter ATP-binding protein n=1 Tax=Paraclostridium bifermentans TaxID=1490 RepID=UPI003D2B1553
MNNEDNIIKVNNLKKYFDIGNGKVLKAVDGVSFNIKRGETLGLVGESGCGKTTCGRTCISLYDKTEGQVLYNGKDVHNLKGRDKKKFTKDVQMIFQNPYTSLNPKLKVRDIISEGIRIHKLATNKYEEKEKVEELLQMVGLNNSCLNRYAHEFSGGQRQRIVIARALAVNPEFLVCDEPISALDVSIQAQIVNLLTDLQKDKSLTYLFIAHDLSMVKYISDRIAVMYLGNLVEITTSEELYNNPMHPYTNILISSIPIPDPYIEKNRNRLTFHEEISSQTKTLNGCCFKSRCRHAKKICGEVSPTLKEISTNHFVACHLY